MAASSVTFRFPDLLIYKYDLNHFVTRETVRRNLTQALKLLTLLDFFIFAHDFLFKKDTRKVCAGFIHC